MLLTYVWTQNGNIVQTTSNTTALTDTLDLTILTNVNVGDVFSVQVTPYDRTDYGLPAIASATVGASVPVAQDGNASISHRSATGVDITLQGTDSDNAPLTFNLFGGLNGGAQHGTVTPVSGTTNEFLYVPTGTYIGTDSFQFTATAGGLTSQPATVTIDLTNAAPVVADFTPSTFATENQTLVVTAPNLLTSATDADGDPLTASIVAQASHGVVTVNADGTFSYTPDHNFTGGDSFTFEANDGAANSNVATVSLTVADIPPTAKDQMYPNVNENSPFTVDAANGMLKGDESFNGNALTAMLVNGPSDGTLTFSSDGSFTYTPNNNYVGADSFTYQVFDGTDLSMVATVNLTVNISQPAPVAVNDAYSVARNGTLTVTATTGVLANDTGSGTLTAVLVTGPSHGALASNTLNPDGSFVYTPDAGFVGTDSFTYTANNGLPSNIATVTITVMPPTLTASNFSFSTGRSTPLSETAAGGVLSTVTGGAGDTLTATEVSARPMAPSRSPRPTARIPTRRCRDSPAPTASPTRRTMVRYRAMSPRSRSPSPRRHRSRTVPRPSTSAATAC